jgi:hypothetical protein
MVKFMQHTTISEVYCDKLKKKKKLYRAIQNKRRGMLTYSVVFLHDKTCPHTDAHTRALLNESFQLGVDHPPYSPDHSE